MHLLKFLSHFLHKSSIYLTIIFVANYSPCLGYRLAQSKQHVVELLSHILIGLDPGPQLLNFIFLLQEEFFKSFTLILFLLHSNLG